MAKPEKPFRLNAGVRRTGGTNSVTEWFDSRVDAAAAFRRYVVNPHLTYVEVWDCAEDTNTAMKLWEFEP